MSMYVVVCFMLNFNNELRKLRSAAECRLNFFIYLKERVIEYSIKGSLFPADTVMTRRLFSKCSFTHQKVSLEQ